MQSGIYIILNLINQKFYVGSSKNIEKRFYHHKQRLNKGRHENPHLQKAWNKYGRNCFSFQIVEKTTLDKMMEREQAWINMFRRTKRLYNIQTEVIVYPEGRDKNISIGLMGLLIGKRNGRFKRLSKDEKIKISLLYKSGNSIKNISVIVGYGHSVIYRILNESNTKIRKCKEKNAVSYHIKPVLQFNLNRKFVREWRSITAAAKGTGLTRNSIMDSCNGKCKGRKYIWEYK